MASDCIPVLGCKSKDDVKESEISLNSIKEAIEELYDFRESYYDRHPEATEEKKNCDVESRLKHILTTLDENRECLEKTDKATYLMLKGKALNARQEYDVETHDTLSKAVKLNPKLVEAWNELGECYWKKGDLQRSQNCYEGILKSTKDKVSLRNLSMVLRQVSTTPEQHTKNICASLAKAKEAVELDISDGRSWYTLANAYLFLYFSASQRAAHLQLAIDAFSRAHEDPKMKYCADLYYNHAMALRHLEDYQNALEAFDRASALDPHWGGPKEKSRNLLKYLSTVDEMIQQKGTLKPRKIQSLLSSTKPRHLGPFRNHATIKSIRFDELKPQKNQGCILVSRVVCNIVSEEKFPFTLCAVDEAATCFAVTIYNLAEGRGFIVGDTVVIPEPFVHCVHVNYQGKEISFKSIRVDSPLELLVNGRFLSVDSQAPLQLQVKGEQE